MRPQVYLKKNEEKRVLTGHPWIFSNEINSVSPSFQDGEVVNVYDYKKKFLGTGYFNSRSLIAIRLLSRYDVPVERAFFEKRILNAIRYREKVIGKRDAIRIVFGESDYLPGLIVDKYGPYLVMQFLTLGMDRFSEEIRDIFQELFTPEAIILRNDSPFRKLEGLKQEKKILSGNLQSENLNVFIYEADVKFKIDILNGQKTGFFLDQRDNRDYFCNLNLTGRGLDCFCYSGSWGVRAAGKSSVTFVDSSESALSIAKFNGELNSKSEFLSFIEEDVFTYLDCCIGKKEKFDWIVLDPPAFVKSKKKVKSAVAGYRNINLKAMRLLEKGGILITSSCSYNLKEDVFVRLLNEAAGEAKRDIRVIAFGSQSKDHPFLLSMPESKYLKCIFLEIN